MVLLCEVDSEGNDYAMAEVPQEVEELITAAGPGMHHAISATQNFLQNMSVDPQVVGVEASQSLIAVRERVVFHLMLFRDHLLEQSKDSVREVKKTLRTYFLDTSYDDFKGLIPILRRKLEPWSKKAGVVKYKFMLLAVDLIELQHECDEKFKDIDSTLSERLTGKGKDATKAMKKAQRMDTLGKAAFATTALGSLAIAKGLITTGGVIAACPPLAPLVATVGLVVAAASRNEASSSAEQHQKQKQELDNECAVISKAIQTVNDDNSRCVAMLADCAQACADFFSYIKSGLEDLSSPDGEIDDPERELRNLHSQMQRQAISLIRACEKYEQCASRVETGIQSLDVFKPANCGASIVEWVRRANDRVP